ASPSASSGGLSRRQFLSVAAAAASGMMATPALPGKPGRSAFLFGATPNSKFAGVQIGAITYSFRSLPSSAEQLLGYLVECGISSTELMGGPILEYLGAPTSDAPPRGAIARMTDPAEQEAATRARAAHDEEMRRWYASPPMDRLESLRSLYADAGVTIHLAKFSPGSDPVASEFAYRAAKALGARGVSNEIGEEACR